MAAPQDDGDGDKPTDVNADDGHAVARPGAGAPANDVEDSEGGAAGLATEESVARYQQLLQRRPFHEAAFNGLVSYYAARNRMEELVADYAERVESLPEDAAARILLARLQLRAGDAEQASQTLAAMADMPASPALARLSTELLVFRAEVAQQIGDFDAAERMLNEATEHTTHVAERLKLGEALADLHIRQGQPDDAAAALQRMAAEFPDHYLHQRHIADALSRRGLHEAAAGQYRAMLAIPEVTQQVDRQCEVLRQLGLALEELNRRDDAIEAYVEAIGMLSSDHWLQRELHDRIVRLYRASNRLDDLADYCTEQIERAPEQTAMRILLADVYAAMEKHDEARTILASAVGLFPADLTLSQKFISFLERIGEIDAAATEYQRIIAQHPDDVELYVAYGQFLAHNKQYEAARNQWKHVLDAQVIDPTLANRLGALFETYELYEDATNAYERAIALAPDQPEAYTALSRLWINQGEKDRAVEALARAADANPENGPLHAAITQAYLNLGLTERALEAIARACELLPENVRFQQMRADLLVANGRLEDALTVRRETIELMNSAFQQSEAIAVLVSMHASGGILPKLVEAETKHLEENPGDVVSLLILARAADAQRDFRNARMWLEQILETNPDNETALTQLARLFDAVGDVDNAVETYQRLIEIAPARSRQHYEAIVDLKLRYANRAGAIETLTEMAKNDADSATVLSTVAEQLVRMGEAERATEYYEKSLTIQPDREDIRLDYGKSLTEAGRYDDAMSAFRTVATGHGDPDKIVDALGRLHDTASQLGRLEELIDDLQQQVSLDPQNTLIARALARMLITEFEYSRAMDLIDMVLRQNPRDPGLAMTKAELHRRLAEFDEAMEVYEQIVRLPQIDRDYVLGEMGKTQYEAGQVDQARRLWKQIQNRLYAGTLFRNNGMHDDAVEVFEEGIRLQPTDYALHRNLVMALDAAGRTEESLKAARRLLDLEPGNVFNIESLAESYLKIGDRGSAAEIASRLFSATPGVVRTPGSGAGHGGTRQSATGMRGGSSYPTLARAMYQSLYGQMSAMYSYGGGAVRSNLDRGIMFFYENSLLAELENVLVQQIANQPENTLLKQAAANLFMTELNKPAKALELLRELEDAPFPLEHQQWLGQCSQRDYMRITQYNLIASKPGLRDARLAALEARGDEALGRDELLELAIIRSSQGRNDEAIDLLQRAVEADENDQLARGMLIDTLMLADRFADAEPHARRMVEMTAAAAERMEAEMIERVRRDFVRSLPLEFQLRVTETMLADIARKWSLGQGFVPWQAGAIRPMGSLRARITLATIHAETGRFDDARAIWKALAPKDEPDVDLFTTLGDVATLYEQEDLAYQFYMDALQAARVLSQDSFLQQIYASSLTMSSWYGGDGSVDATFNSIVDVFANRDSLLQLYDFLRDTDQEGKARRIVEQYDLGPRLIDVYRQRVVESAEAFGASAEDAMRKSVGYFANVCKLAELEDHAPGGGGWEAAYEIYTSYLEDFPDELALLSMLSDAAEAQGNLEEAIEWEKQSLECKTRLASRARQWAQRELTLTPSRPKVLQNAQIDPWSWSSMWGRNRWGYGGMRNQLDRAPTWLRLTRLYLARDNTIAAADAMQRAVAESGRNRSGTLREVLTLIKQRQLTTEMLPVLRSLAIYAPDDEDVQFAFAESLEANARKDVAAEVCRRMLRRGVSDLAVLAQVRRKIEELSPDSADTATTVATLEEEVAANPGNLRERLRLARAYFYSLRIDDAITALEALAEEAPNMEAVRSLLVEAYTLKGDQEKLIEALHTQIPRLSDDDERREARWRLVGELLTVGRNDEALEEVKQLGDPRDPTSYERVAGLLHYFGKHAEASAVLEQAGRSQSRNMGWGADTGNDLALAQSLVLQGDIEGAVEKIRAEIDEQARQQVQYGGMQGMYGSTSNPFASLQALLLLSPELTSELRTNLQAELDANPQDPQALRVMMQFHHSAGRSDLAEQFIDQMVEKGMSDQSIMAQLIDRALRTKQYDDAIEMAEAFIEQQPKPQIPPGTPPQYAGMMMLQSPRAFMICKLGDVYWEMGQKDKAFETYERIVDDKVDSTRLALAAIWILHGRLDAAREYVDKTLEDQEFKQPELLQLRALLAVMEGDMDQAFEALAEAAKPGSSNENDPYAYMFGGGGRSPLSLLAIVAREMDGLDRFQQFVEERLERDPHDWENYSVLANTLHTAGRPDEALAVLDRAAAVTTLAQQALGRKRTWMEGYATSDELIPLYEKLIELTEREAGSSATTMARGANPYAAMGGQNGSAQGLRESLADLLWERGDDEKARDVFLERMDAQQPDTYTQLAEAYLKRGDDARAKEAFDKALSLDPEHADTLLGLAELAVDDGRYADALKHMVMLFRSGRQSERHRYNMIGYSSRAPNSWYSELVSDSRMNEWAMRIAKDAAIASELASPSGHEDGSTDEPAYDRLLVALLVGDWVTLESDLSACILDQQSYDPLLWTLWAKVQQRKLALDDGALDEAARALEFLQRATKTSIGTHREQLELVLAGKQVKEAAAGSRTGQPGMPNMPAGMSSRMASYPSYYNQYFYGGGNDEASHLSAIYIRQGDYEKAERQFLLSSGTNITYVLPSLASLVWAQGEGVAQSPECQRALELMHLYLVLSGSANQYGGGNSGIVQYANMLADTGRADEAARLLIRAYRWGSGESSVNMYASLYVGHGAADQSFEQGEESAYAQSLHTILKRHGMLDRVIDELEAKVAERPDDRRTAKLILSLEMRDRRWAKVSKTLTTWREQRPEDPALREEQLHAFLQLGAWDRARELIVEIKADDTKQGRRWMLHEAFVELMRDDPAAAVAAIQPLIDEPTPEDASRVRVVLAVAERYDVLCSFLESLRASGELDPHGLDMLWRAYAIHGQRDAALRLALDEFWKQDAVLSESSQWYRAVHRLVRDAEAEGGLPSSGLESFEAVDRALVALIAEGPEAGATAFSDSLHTAKDDVDALRAQRGLLLCLLQSPDPQHMHDALKLNASILEFLESRRQDLWYEKPRPSLEHSAAQTIDQYSRSGTASVALSGSLSSILTGVSRSLDVAGQLATYEELWRAHERLQRSLLAGAGDLEQLRTLIARQARTFDAGRGNTGYSYNQYQAMLNAYQSRSARGQSAQADGTLMTDRAAFMRKILGHARRFEDLEAEFDALGSRVDEDEWMLAGVTYAVGQQPGIANQWRADFVALQLARLRAGDVPTFSTGDQWSRWRWSSNNEASRDIRQISMAISAALNFDADDAESKDVMRFGGGLSVVDQPWEFALVDPATERELLRQADCVGPGWGNTQTVTQLVWHLRSRNDAQGVIELLERAFDVGPETNLAPLLRSQRLGDYLWACFAAEDFDRLEHVFARAQAFSSTLENDVALGRLVMLRLKGENDEADELERDLLSRCRIEPANTHRLDARLVDPNPNTTTAREAQMLAMQQQMQMMQMMQMMQLSGAYGAVTPYQIWNSNSGWAAQGSELPTVASLARSLGVRYQPHVEFDDVTLEEICLVYQGKGLDDDAARLLKLRLETCVTPYESFDVRHQIAEALAAAGDVDAAQEAARALEQDLLNAAAEAPTDAALAWRLAQCYQSQAFGSDYVRAYDALAQARRLDPAYDSDESLVIEYLYKAGRYDEAWTMSRVALMNSRDAVSKSPTLLYAALSAHHAGDTGQAAPLMRQALYLYPTHPLAIDIEELVHASRQ